jgi:hypothetical protein
LDIPAELLSTHPIAGSEAEPADHAHVAAGIGEDADARRQGFLAGDQHWQGGQAIELEPTAARAERQGRAATVPNRPC